MDYVFHEAAIPGVSRSAREPLPSHQTDAALTERVVEDLDREGLLDKPKIIVTDVTRRKYGYPVYDLSYGKNVKIVDDYFDSIDVPLCGRFAQFESINSDECMRRAIAPADRLNASED